MRERHAAAGGRGAGTGRAWKQDEWAVAPLQMRACSGTRESGFGECKGSYWIIFELESRDFMHYMARKHAGDLFAIPAADAVTVMMVSVFIIIKRKCMCCGDNFFFIVPCSRLHCATRALVLLLRQTTH
jgi:hypothetical protein